MRTPSILCRAALVATTFLVAMPFPGANAAEPAKTPRHALVIGNSKYPIGELLNPRNDASAIAERLRAAGFSVTLKLDARRRELADAIRDFGQVLDRDKGVGVFYYAGHALQLNWRNFLVPVDAKIKKKTDIQAETVDISLLIDSINRTRNPLNLIILDACRNNPFGPDFRTDDKGLSQLDAPPGTFIAYATAPGNTAEDGDGTHGLYTDNLLKEMQTPGAPIEDVFKRVRLSVRRASEGGQIPWESTSLESDFSFLPGQTPRDKAKEFEADLATWQQLRAAQSIAELEAFIRVRPNGKFAELAQFRLDHLLAAKGEKPVAPRAPTDEACVPGSAGAAATYSGKPVPFKVGERYDYRRSDLLTGAEKEKQSSKVSKIENDEVMFDDGKTVTDLFGNNVRAPDGRKWTPYQFFINDYQIGKRWQAQFLVTLADGKQVNNTFDLRVAGRERITLPAGTYDAFRIEATGANLTNGATLERTVWIAPEKMRGFLAMESLVRRGATVIEGERVELTDYSTGGWGSSGDTGFKSSY
jgi:hypothetical protein